MKSLINKIFYKNYRFVVEVQLDEYKNPCVAGLFVRTLDELCVESYSYKSAYIKACNIAKNKHSKYSNFLYLC